MNKGRFLIGLILLSTSLAGQADPRIYEIIQSVSQERIGNDITTLAGFGTRHTLSDTVSSTRGIGAARRWIKAEFDKISSDCGGCLEVFYQRNLISKAENPEKMLNQLII